MYHNCINMISTVGTIYSHSWTVTAYGARHVTDGQTERKERGYMIVLDYRDRRPLYEQVTEKTRRADVFWCITAGQSFAVGSQYGNGAFH
mgnify:CR=1 FL=1